MAFKGSHTLKNGVKTLLQDYCTSEYNLTQSKWPKVTDLNDTQKLLQRLDAEY